MTVLLALIAGLVVWGGLAIALDAYGRRAVPKMNYDAIVVPGCKVWAGGQPSNALRRRVTHAVSLYQQGRATHIIMTGGVGTHPPAEAHVAADIARRAGVPDSAIVCEDRSTNTKENASFSAAMTHHGHPVADWHVLVVSDAYHAWRCARLFRAHFASATARGSTPGWRLRIRGSLREVGSIALGMLRN